MRDEITQDHLKLDQGDHVVQCNAMQSKNVARNYTVPRDETQDSVRPRVAFFSDKGLSCSRHGQRA